MRNRLAAWICAGVLAGVGGLGMAARIAWSVEPAREMGGQHPGSAFRSVPRPDLPGRVLPRFRGGTAGRDRPWHTSSSAGPRFSQPPLSRVLDLTRLDPPMQTTLSLLLLLPFGVLVTAVFRNVIGVQTFGTFTPSLIALTFTCADWRTGLGVLGGVLLVGIGGRRLLNRLRLLMVPRLGLVITMAVLFLALAVSACDLVGVALSAQVVILSTVILAMVIERFHVSGEENGLKVAFAQLAWTFVVGACCWALFAQRFMAPLVLAFPESLLVAAAALLLMGHYTGYRVVELWRFRHLAAPAGSD